MLPCPSVCPPVSQSVCTIRVRRITLLFDNLKTIKARCMKLGTWTAFGSLPWRSRSQHDNEAKSCPALKLVFWIQIVKLFHRNDYHIELICHEQHLDRYIEGQGHSMTLQKNHVQTGTLLFGVGFYKCFTEMITILRWCVAYNLWVATLKVKVMAWPFSKSCLAHNFVI